MNDTTDKHLVVQIKKGDKIAFKKLYEQYHKQLFFIAKKYLKDEQLAEDAVQDIFVKVWNSRATLDQNKSVKSYLFTILKNHLLNKIRRKSIRHKVLEYYKKNIQNKMVSTPIDDLLYEEYKELFARAIEKLTPSQREVVKMKMIQKYTNEKIASIRNVSVNTVKTQYYLGSKFVKEYLKKYGNIT